MPKGPFTMTKKGAFGHKAAFWRFLKPALWNLQEMVNYLLSFWLI